MNKSIKIEDVEVDVPNAPPTADYSAANSLNRKQSAINFP